MSHINVKSGAIKFQMSGVCMVGVGVGVEVGVVTRSGKGFFC